MRRRLLAIVAFGTLVVLVVLVVYFMLQSSVLLLGGLVGLAVALAGCWLLAAGCWLLAAGWRVGGWLMRVLVLLAVTVETARAALVKDLHELDRVRSHPSRLSTGCRSFVSAPVPGIISRWISG